MFIIITLMYAEGDIEEIRARKDVSRVQGWTILTNIYISTMKIIVAFTYIIRAN